MVVCGGCWFLLCVYVVHWLCISCCRLLLVICNVVVVCLSFVVGSRWFLMYWRCVVLTPCGDFYVMLDVVCGGLLSVVGPLGVGGLYCYVSLLSLMFYVLLM